MDREGPGPVPFCSFVPLSHRLPRSHWTRNRGGSCCCRNPSLPLATPQGCRSRSSSLYFCSPFPPSHSLRTRAEGPSVGRGSGLGSQQAPGGPSGQGNLATLPFDPLPSQWFPNFPLRAWEPFPSPSRPSGAPVLSRLHFSSPFTPPMPPVLPGRWGFLPCPWSPTGA